MFRRLALLVLGIIFGSLGTYFLVRTPSHRWMKLGLDQKGLEWDNDVLFGGNIPFPNVTAPQGQAKFVDRGIGKGTELGYIVTAKMDKLDVNKLPEKYKKVEHQGDYTIGPTDTVVYEAHLAFTLKDADDFTLMTTASEPLEIWSGQENKLQGFAKDSIPDALIKRTKRIEVMLDFDKCDTCKP